MGDEGAIPQEAVRTQLDRILATKGFASAGRLSRLLRHVVEKALAGEADQLKEYSVGVEVFDRDEKYDPRLDSIVRVEAGRLRSRLDEYYNGAGAADEVRISLPRGAYIPRFERRDTAAAPLASVEPPLLDRASPESTLLGATSAGWIRFRALRLGVTAFAIAVAVTVWIGGRGAPRETPTIAVLAFEQYASTGEDESVAAQLTDGVTTELARLKTLGVVSHTSAMQFAGLRKPLKEIATALDADVILEGSVDRRPDGIVVTARLVDARTDRKVWVEDFRGQGNDLRDLNQRIAAAASAAILARRSALP